jgi:predicted PurR-regulated permease PerM
MKYADLETSTKVILKVIFAVVVLWFLWAVRDIVTILLLSLILASAMEPLADYLSLRKVPRVVSVLFVYVVVLGVAALVIYLIIPPAISQYQFLIAHLPQYGQVLQERFGSYISLGNVGQDVLSSFSGGNLVTSTFGAVSGVLTFIVILVISFYLVAEEKGMKSFVSAFLPEQHHEFTLNLLEKIQRKMGFWVLGQFVASCSVFLIAFIGLSLLHVQYALFLALLTGLFEVTPYVGPILSGILATSFAFIQQPSLGIFVAILYIIIHTIEGYFLVPKIMQKAVGTSPLLVLFALLVGYQLAGIIGLLIAVPLSTAITIIVQEFWPGTKMP